MPWTDPGDGTFPSLGPVLAQWIEEHIVVPDGELQGEPFMLDGWQYEFLVWYYRVKPRADPEQAHPNRAFVFERGGQLVAPQKTGKGPFSAAVVIAEAAGPVLFDGWDADGQPVGRPWKTPWIQVTAASEAQTDNVWFALIPMIELGAIKADMPDTGVTRINLPGGGKIEPVTAAARSRLGQRITHALEDEAHSWTKQNKGAKLADTQRRNLAGMGGRFLETGNAWDPAEESVAQKTYENEDGVYKMMMECGPGSVRNKADRKRMLKQVYAGSPWVDLERISAEIDALLKKGELAQAERYFLNRIVPGEDQAFDPKEWAKLAKPDHVVPPKALITVGVDGARYVDALAVVATEVVTGHQWPLIIMERPPNAADDYEHDFDEVDGVMVEAMATWDVWRVYIDPGSQYANIAPLVDMWQGRWGEKKIIPWMMNQQKKTALMIRGYASAIGTGDLSHSGDEVLTAHVVNARRKTVNVYDEDGHSMWVITKDRPGSPLKIDGAAAASLSWEARGDAVAAGKTRKSVYSGRRKPGEKAERERTGEERAGDRIRLPITG